MNPNPPDLPSSQKDRSIWIILAGSLILLLGLLCGAMVPLMLSAALLTESSTTGGTTLRQILPGALFYLGLAIAFFVLGVGVIRKRKWARDLLLAFSWLWLVVGVMGCLIFLFLMNMMKSQFGNLPDGQTLPDSVVWVILAISLGIIAFIYVLVPAALVFFLGNRHIKEAFRFHHPQPGWTDRLSTPALILFVLLFCGGFSLMGSFAYTPVLPLFGFFLAGVPAGLLIVLISLLWFILAWGTAKLRTWAWWGTWAVLGIFWSSGVVTFSTRKLMDLYKAMELPPEQLAQIEKTGFLDTPWLPVATLLSAIPFFVLLLLARKDFFHFSRSELEA